MRQRAGYGMNSLRRQRRKIAFRLTTTYAGFENEASLLLELYKRGLEQPKLGEDLYGGDGLLMFWSHKPIAHWQDAAWEARMRRERPSVFQRHFFNEFASSASTTFIDLKRWDDCVSDDRLGFGASRSFPAMSWIGLDGSMTSTTRPRLSPSPTTARPRRITP